MMYDVKLTRKLGENHFQLPYVSVLVSMDPEEFERLAHSYKNTREFIENRLPRGICGGEPQRGPECLELLSEILYAAKDGMEK
jgi:hypothetical protein